MLHQRRHRLTAPRWLDQIWLIIIALAFLIGVPIWFILSVERMGWRFVVGSIGLALFLRYSPRPHSLK